MVEIVANFHAHTPYSDGHSYHRDIAQAAAKAGLHAVIVTDHNVYVRGVDGAHGGVTVLAGEEVHDCTRNPQANHCLVLGAGEAMSSFAADPQKLVHEVNRRGGLTFFAHPYEVASPINDELIAIPWESWSVTGNTGIELWNYMTELKARLPNWPAALFSVLVPSLAIVGPFRQTLRKWDELLRGGRRVVAIGNADAHGTPYRLGPIRKTVLPYAYLFRCVNTHVLLDRPLARDAQTDRRLIYGALRAGHCFVAYDLAGDARGFTFTARSGAETAIMGDEIKRKAATEFEVSCPAVGDIRLLRDGHVVARRFGRSLRHLTIEPGVYRVEVRRFFRFAVRGWIFSNPIYVR